MNVIWVRRTLALTLIAVLGSSMAVACSCSNRVPLQKGHSQYRERAVFTAHVIQLMGNVGIRNGKQHSRMAIAVVRERFWGLPWYWPKIVVLDGGSFCNIELADDEDYLVSGFRMRYGFLDVSVCSRTSPLRWAQVDLRTLDGSRCSAPGGTIVGQLYTMSGNGRDTFAPVPGETFAVADVAGKRYRATTDKTGLFELAHLPAGPYEIVPESGGKFIPEGRIQVEDGACVDASQAVQSH
jgi:hypothetical protein